MTGIERPLQELARMALRGEWGPLVERLLADLIVARPGKLSAAAAQAATLKARRGSKRGAADVLLGGPRVPPGPDADRTVRAVFQCGPLAESEQARRRQALEAAAAVPKKHRLVITARLVGHQAGKIKPVAGTWAERMAEPGTSSAL